MINTSTEKAAVLVFVGIWKCGGDLQTGNFVPQGKNAPEGIPSDRMYVTRAQPC